MKTLETVCHHCDAPCTLTGMALRNALKSGRGYCSPECAKAGRFAILTKQPVEMACTHCGKTVTVKGGTGGMRYHAIKRGRAYCSPECSEAGRRSLIAAANLGRKRPPRSAEWRAKHSAVMKGRRPVGKNGDPTPAEAKLLSYLPTNWKLHHHVPGWKGKGGCDVDIAEPKLKIAVEIDGRGHNHPTQKAHDAKKTAWLLERGWHCLRTTNRAVEWNVRLQAEVCKMLAGLYSEAA